MLKTVVTTLGLVLAACSVGEVKGSGGGGDAPDADPRAATYDSMVKPLAMNKGCLDVGCHGGIQTPQMNSFDMMTSNQILADKYLKQPASTNILIIKDDPTPGTHQARPYFDTTEKAAISAWIESAP